MTPTPRSELIEAALRLIEDQRAFINGELTCRAGETDRQCINRSKAEMLQRAIDVTATLATPSAVGAPVVEGCHADHDGDCTHKDCPQLRDGEPRKSHRSCPLLVPIPPAPVGIAEVERLILDYVNAHMRAVNTKGVQAPAAKEALDALLDSITRFAGGKDGWQPIETAPLGPKILVLSREMGVCVACACWLTDKPDEIRWGVVNDIYVTPTHWKPLPAGLSTNGEAA